MLTVEEGCLRAASARPCSKRPTTPGSATAHVRRLGLPDRFVVHAERDEQLAEVGLDVDGIVRAALELARAVGLPVAELTPEPEAEPTHPDGTGRVSAVAAKG